MIKNRLEAPPEEMSPSGGGLSVLICSRYDYPSNWMAFSAWHSVYKNLPGANVALSVSRPPKVENYYYSWVYKFDVRFRLHKDHGAMNKVFGVIAALRDGLVRQPLFVIDTNVVAAGELNRLSELKEMRSRNNGSVCYLNGVPVEKIPDTINRVDVFEDDEVVGGVSSDGASTFVDWGEGFGNFNKSEWEKGKILPPFGNARYLGSSSPSFNEKKVALLWSRMGNLWNMSNQVEM